MPEVVTKRCARCRNIRDVSEFSPIRRVDPERLRSYCKPCTRSERKEQYGRIPSRSSSASHTRMIAREYGLTPCGYEEMLDRQGNKCAICLNFETRTTRAGNRMRLAVDHCHSSGMVRALLCGRCNSLVAALENASPKLIFAAQQYLAQHD